MNSYTLKTPIKARKGGEDTLIETLDIPEKITVGMMRAAQREAPTSQPLLFAICAAEQWSGLTPFAAAKLTFPDARAYTDACSDAGLLNDESYESSFEVPEIKPVKTAIAKITAGVDRPIEMAAQILEASGIARVKLDALDVREILPHLQTIIEAMIDPKM
jgi:hypothetical protein